MQREIKVPPMGESISEATIASILKPSGSLVRAEEELLELETDKINQVLFSPAAGLLTLKVQPQEVVKIGQVIGFITPQASGAAEAPAPVPQKKPAPAAVPPPPIPAPEMKRTTGKEELISELLASPKQASELPPTPVPAPVQQQRETRRKMTNIRKVIGERMVKAQQTTAMLTTFNEVDMTAVMEIRQNYKELFPAKHGVRLGLLSFFIKATVSALQAFPDFNSYIEGDEIVQRSYYDIGIAVGTDRGLVVPVLRNCDTLSFADCERAIEGFAKKAREGKLTVDDLRGGGFTITNGGVYGSLLSTPILNPPQSGILGMHKIQKRPVVVQDAIVIRSMMYLAVSYDHRLIDGKAAVQFLVHIKEQLEDPSRLLLGM